MWEAWKDLCLPCRLASVRKASISPVYSCHRSYSLAKQSSLWITGFYPLSVTTPKVQNIFILVRKLWTNVWIEKECPNHPIRIKTLSRGLVNGLISSQLRDPLFRSRNSMGRVSLGLSSPNLYLWTHTSLALFHM